VTGTRFTFFLLCFALIISEREEGTHELKQRQKRKGTSEERNEQEMK